MKIKLKNANGVQGHSQGIGQVLIREDFVEILHVLENQVFTSQH